MRIGTQSTIWKTVHSPPPAELVSDRRRLGFVRSYRLLSKRESRMDDAHAGSRPLHRLYLPAVGINRGAHMCECHIPRRQTLGNQKRGQTAQSGRQQINTRGQL